MPSVSTAPAATPDTKTRYLDAAEELFVELGYEGASVRAISRRAEANLGTLTYYFGTKEALFRAVCERRFTDIIREQITRLKACSARLDAGEPVALEDAIRALVEPSVMAHADVPELQHKVRRFYGRAFTEPSEVVLRVTEEVFRETSNLALRCTRPLLPQLDERTFYRRYICAIGAFFFAQAFTERMTYVLPEMPEENDWAAASEEIVAFMARGLGADAD